MNKSYHISFTSGTSYLNCHESKFKFPLENRSIFSTKKKTVLFANHEVIHVIHGFDVCRYGPMGGSEQ